MNQNIIFSYSWEPTLNLCDHSQGVFVPSTWNVLGNILCDHTLWMFPCVCQSLSLFKFTAHPRDQCLLSGSSVACILCALRQKRKRERERETGVVTDAVTLLLYRALLWWWSIHSRPASVLYLSLLWKNGLYRVSASRACSIWAQWSFHWSGKFFQSIRMVPPFATAHTLCTLNWKTGVSQGRCLLKWQYFCAL